jgi:hypothetical protein
MKCTVCTHRLQSTGVWCVQDPERNTSNQTSIEKDVYITLAHIFANVTHKSVIINKSKHNQ